MWIIQWIINNASRVYRLLSDANDFLYGLYQHARDTVWRFFVDEIPELFGSRTRLIYRALTFFDWGINTLRNTYHTLYNTGNEWAGILIFRLSDLTGWWWDRLFHIIRNIYDRIRWVTETAYQTLVWIVYNVRSFLEWLYYTAQGFFRWLFDQARAFLYWLIQTAQGFLRWLYDTAQGFLYWLTQTAQGFLRWLYDIARNFLTWMIQTAQGFIRWLYDIAKDFLYWLTQTAQGFIRWLYDTARGFIEWLFSIRDKLVFAFQSAWDVFRSFLENPFGYIFSVVLALAIDLIEWFIVEHFGPEQEV